MDPYLRVDPFVMIIAWSSVSTTSAVISYLLSAQIDLKQKCSLVLALLTVSMYLTIIVSN
jgi:hypothetical protein